MRKTIFNRTSLTALALAMACAPALAQETVPVNEGGAEEDARTLERVVVTGSLIRRQSQADLASPLDTFSSVDLDNIGAQNLADLTQTLTINTGAQNNPDAFTQGGTTGTSNINLRGLGVGSTLVLLNGKRQTLSAAPTNDGVSFVDTASLVPLIAVERVEILKDGASTLYGSDAVAGVANFITREDYEGVLFSGDYTVHDSEGDYSEYNLQALAGKSFGKFSIMGAVSYLDRTALTTAERRLSETLDDASSLGNPGAFFGVPGVPAGAPFIDPNCANVGGIPGPASAATASLVPLGIGFCRFDFGDFFNIVPEEQRLLIYTSAKLELNDTTRLKADFSRAENSALRGNSPTFPFLQLGKATVPTFNPFNPFGANLLFFGRASGIGGEVSPSDYQSNTWRFSTTLEGEFDSELLKNASYSLSLVRAENDFVNVTEDVATDRFGCALRGFNISPAFNAATGLDCTASNPFLTANGSSIPADGTFFNPFGTSIGTGVNDALLDYVIQPYISDRASDLTVVEGVVTGDVYDLPAGPVSVALGTQWRRQDISASFDEIASNDGFAFLIGDQAFEGSQNVYALFAEAAVPLADWADLQLAIRFEDYGGSLGSTVDPKIALLLRPTEDISLRGSFSTSFRAPTPFQTDGQSTTLQQVNDPVAGGTAFVAVRAAGNTDLAPENSIAYNIGATWEPVSELQFNIDYFSFDFDDAIVQTAPQAVLDANPTGPAIIRSPAGTVVQINNGFVNAASIKTSGVDFSVRYSYETEFGTFSPSLIGTYVLDYELQQTANGSKTDGAGNRNFRNFGSPSPEWRFNAGLEYSYGAHGLNLYGRYIDSYTDDQNGDVEIESDFRVDVQYSLAVNELLGIANMAQLTVGARNVLDVTAPYVSTNGGFDSRVADPRGRLITVGLDLEF